MLWKKLQRHILFKRMELLSDYEGLHFKEECLLRSCWTISARLLSKREDNDHRWFECNIMGHAWDSAMFEMEIT